MLLFGILILYSFIYLGLHIYFLGAKLFLILNLILLIPILLQRPKIIPSRLNFSLLLMLAVIMVSVPFSSYIRISFEFLIYLLKMALIAFVTYFVLNSAKKMTIFLWMWLAYQFAIVMNTMTTLNMSEAAGRYGATGLAEYSFLGDANDFALALNIALPVAFYLMLQTRNKIFKSLLASAGIFIIIGIVVSQSRGGFITLISTMIFIILSQGKKRVLGLTITAFVVTGIFVLAPASYVERMQTITGPALEKGDTGYGRIALWKAGLKMMIDHPITGVGLGRYQAAYGHDYHRKEDRKWRVAHNSYISMGAETGIAGFLLYIYLLYTIFKENNDLRKSLRAAGMEKHFIYFLSKALTAALVAYCVGTMFLTAWYYIHIYLIIALTLAIRRIMVEEYGFEIQDSKDKILIKAPMMTD